MTYGEGLTPKQRDALAFLVKNREKRFSETALARALGVHKATMNHHLRKLEAVGAIERQSDPADGRRLIIVPAPGIELPSGDAMDLRTLIATIGFGERHILPSLRLLP